MKIIYHEKKRFLYLFLILFFTFLSEASVDEGEREKAVESTEDSTKEPDSNDEAKERWEDPSPTKIIASPTAFVQEKGTVNINFTTCLGYLPPPFVLNFQDVTIGISKNFDIQLSLFFPPIYYVGFGLYPKFGFQLGRFVRVGLMLDLAITMPYNIMMEVDYYGCEDEEINVCKPWLFYGITPVLTVGTNDYHANLSVNILGYSGPTGDCITDLDYCHDPYIHHHMIVLPSLGASLRILRWLKINLEVLFMYMYNFTTEDPYVMAAIFPMVGFKIFGKRFYGNINLEIPAFYGDEEWGSPLVYLSLSFGFVVP